MMDRNPDLWRNVVDLGHEIGNHSLTHRVLRSDRLSEDEIAEDIAGHQVLLDQVVGKHIAMNFFRPPGGYIESLEIRKANEQGLEVVNWSLSSGGTGSASTSDSSFENVIRARNGDIVLMHCIPNDTGRLNEIIERIQDRGLEIVTVSRLLDWEQIPPVEQPVLDDSTI